LARRDWRSGAAGWGCARLGAFVRSCARAGGKLGSLRKNAWVAGARYRAAFSDFVLHCAALCRIGVDWTARIAYGYG
jgi:hypothetical protein